MIDLTMPLHDRGHIVMTDNFFTSIPLFMDLYACGIRAIGTLRSDRKYVPSELWAKSNTKNRKAGWVDYRMHESGHVCCVVW